MALQFMQTFTVSAFKMQNNITAINIIENPKTNKQFFVSPDNSTISGKIAAGWKKDPAISYCKDSVTNDEFFMLHKRGVQANVLETI